MDIEMFRTFCLGLPGTTEDLKWGEHLCFLIHEKIYVIASLDEGTISFKCEPEEFNDLVARDGIRQAAHFAKGQWITLQDIEVVTDRELKVLITRSRELVLAKLPKKLQALYLPDIT
ncbi:MmcQ/YjbR family DNA-binding protein [Pedobacter duraquae]|uniref:Putative DNA-binding protein (MmcQ/YjbR family) n=1 Tax=Pedobacter duraquae TaxID=425511 RepID=A0A4R6IR74_9SPHI|nr:MmcQ/YjbR family DNA-binding protein [Pedobacter duraquae]TDO24889.1 putative DNA-binding protein (MmcQ/YjbR family) [Pedobacter duraquae]